MMLFVCGTGRCGHTVVAQTIARHPDVAALPFESRFIIDPDGILDFYASYSTTWSYYLCGRRLKRLERFLDDVSRRPSWPHRLLSGAIRALNPDGRILSPRAYDQWELDRHFPNFRIHSRALLDRLIAFPFSACWFGTGSYRFAPALYHAPPMNKAELAEALGDFLRAIIWGFLDRQGKSHFVDSNVFTFSLAKELLEVLPEAKILHVYRDPRDVVASYVRQRWCPQNKAQAAHIVKAMMEHWWTVRRELPAGSYGELGFEGLIEDTEEMLRATCEFYDLPFHENMLGADLGYHNIGRWRREFSPGEKKQVHKILGDIIERLGYS